MNKKRLLSNLMLLLTAFIWGSSFVAQSMGSDHLGALSFCGIRYPISVIAMIPVVMVTQAAKR
ncbi:MAG: EamA family transporter, partial [Firmicutes bacterium]|nr:EamA family transporter [Bacillota bacterium]